MPRHEFQFYRKNKRFSPWAVAYDADTAFIFGVMSASQARSRNIQ